MESSPSITLGIAPRLPSFLQQWAWLTQPIRAERAAAFRISIGLVLLVDVLVQYLPEWKLLFGPDGIGSPEVHAQFLADHWARWSVLPLFSASWWPPVLLGIWAVSALGLMLGYHPRIMALIAWVIAVSIFYSHPNIHNGGDRIKILALFMLMFLPSDGAWSIRRHPASRGAATVFVHPWPIRIMFLQLCVVYFFNGYYKLIGPEWQQGTIMHYVVHDPGWAHWSGEFFPMPALLLNVLCWGTIIWELGFPLFVIVKPTRNLTLFIGVFFHLMTFVHLEVGLFPMYALCGYLPCWACENLRRTPKA